MSNHRDLTTQDRAVIAKVTDTMMAGLAGMTSPDFATVLDGGTHGDVFLLLSDALLAELP